MSESIPTVYIFSDGGAEPNPGRGGYGTVLKYMGHMKELSEGFELTTNNRMELMGAIAGLKALKMKSRVILTSDSRYVVDGIEKGWAVKWRANGWKRNKKEKAINADLWGQLLNEIAKHEVTFRWVRGHTGHPENERCDALATAALNGRTLKKDDGYFIYGMAVSENNAKGPDKGGVLF